MLKKGDLKYENIYGRVSKGEGLIVSWNNWYFFPKNTISLYIIRIKDIIDISNNSNINSFRHNVIDSSVENYILPNTGYYYLTISNRIEQDNYFILILDDDNTHYFDFKDLVKNGLITKPMFIYDKPNLDSSIVLLSPKEERPYGYSDNIDIKYKLISDLNEDKKNNEYVSVHIYMVNPNNIEKKEHSHAFENVNSDLIITGLGSEHCTRYYTIIVKRLNYPFHSDKSSSYFWVLPKKSYPLYYSINEINSRNELCKRIGFKYGMFPNVYEFITLLVIISVNILAFVLLGTRINSYQRRKKKIFKK